MTPAERSRLVASAFATQAIAIGLTVGSFSVFMAPLEAEFGASRSEVSLVVALWNLAMGVASPFAGRALDRGSPRMVLLAGAVTSAASLLGASLATQLWHVQLFFGVGTAVGTTMLGPLASSTVVANRVREQPGRALGLANTGAPAGPLIAAPLSAWGIGAFGWRATFAAFAVVTLVAGVGLVVFGLARRTPSSDGEASAGHAAGAPAGMPWLRRPSFWGLVLGVGIVNALGIAVGAHLVGFGAARGASVAAAAVLISAMSGAAIAGNATFGWASDRFAPHRLFVAAACLLALAFAGLLVPMPYAVVALACVALGLCAGGMMPVYAAMITRHFGLGSFGRVMGAGGLVTLPLTFATPLLAGVAFDRTGDYAAAIAGAIALVAVAAALVGGLVGAQPEPAPSR